MPFSANERVRLLQVKGVGPKVIERLEQLGIDSFDTLARQDAQAICAATAAALGASCWKNSPQARNAVAQAIAAAAQALAASAELRPITPDPAAGSDSGPSRDRPRPQDRS